ELVAEDDKHLGARRGVGDAEKRRDVEVDLRQRPELEAWPDQKLCLERRAMTRAIVLIHKRELRLEPDIDLAISNRAADSDRPFVRSFLRVVRLVFPHKIAAPMPARHDLTAEQKFDLGDIRPFAFLLPF